MYIMKWKCMYKELQLDIFDDIKKWDRRFFNSFILILCFKFLLVYFGYKMFFFLDEQTHIENV
jgi:hypothetical protein